MPKITRQRIIIIDSRIAFFFNFTPKQQWIRDTTLSISLRRKFQEVCVYLFPIIYNLLQYAEEKYVFDANLSFVRPNINPWVFYLTAYTNITIHNWWNPRKLFLIYQTNVDGF